MSTTVAVEDRVVESLSSADVPTDPLHRRRKSVMPDHTRETLSATPGRRDQMAVLTFIVGPTADSPTVSSPGHVLRRIPIVLRQDRRARRVRQVE